ncbi:hypothetical protein GCM10009665_78210 [Kitasatospora nipponensis]|uniref:Uncharacterized protein n=1 Tax=Kitasatospora nipponensis TaxID=258049 RepID=A0ABN1T9S3_9ACTN
MSHLNEADEHARATEQVELAELGEAGRHGGQARAKDARAAQGLSNGEEQQATTDPQTAGGPGA